MRRLALLALLPACTDYNLNTKEDPLPGADTGPLTGEDPPDPDDPDKCGDQVFPGYGLEQNGECVNTPATGTFTPVIEYKKDSWSVDPYSTNIMMTPIVAPLNDDNGDGKIDQDDIPDILVVTYGSYGTLRAVSGDGAFEIFNVPDQLLQGQCAIAAGDIDNDGKVEIIACTSNTVKAFENDGTLKWTSPSIAGHLYGISDAPAIADMNGDGSPEIIVGSAILSSSGAIMGLGSYGAGLSDNVGATSFAADIDGDGVQEVVTGNALYRPNGTAIWYNGEEDGYVAVANFDADDKGEIVVMRSGRVRLQDDDGTVLWPLEITTGTES